jgi:hypothetical protein
MTDKEKWLSCTDLEKYRIVKKYYHQTNESVSTISGNTKNSIEIVTTRKSIPAWLKYALHNFAVERGYVNEE